MSNAKTTRHCLLACTLIAPLAAAQTAAPVAPSDARAGQCPAPAIAPEIATPPDRSTLPAYLYARNFDAEQAGVAVATGNVELVRGDQNLRSDEVRYDTDEERVEIPGAVQYRDAQLWLNAGDARYDLNDDTGAFNMVEYGLVGSSARGDAETLRVEGGANTHATGIHFTTCPGDDPVWVLSAGELDLDHEEGRGVARNAKLTFGNVPILYLPWFPFPIDSRRQSGFLYPAIGKADDTGFELAAPYYWNIAPNQDATITPRWFTERGVMLDAEYRLLTKRSFGQLNFDVLPDDDLTGETRYQYRVNHDMAINPSWHSDVAIHRVSDDDYFQDFGRNLAQTSRQYLRSRAGIDGGGRYWTAEIMADDFQVIDDAVGPLDEPYRRLPRMVYTLDRPVGRSGLLLSFDSEAVYFARDLGIEGARADVLSQLTWDVTRGWGFARPSVGYRWTGYALDNTSPVEDDGPTRGLPIYSVDSGLFFDRDLAGGGTQTLEPRLYYLYVPFEAQDDLPDFDTGPLTFGWSSLFHYNRFTGADRQSNANQVTLGLRSRTFAADGFQRWSVAVAQGFYFEDPMVTLDDEPLDDNLSPILAEATWNPTRSLLTRVGLQWDWDDSELDVATIGADWRGEYGQRLAFEYRFRRDRVDQIDVRALWPFGDRWRVFSQVNWSFDDSDLLEAQFGVEYESCCWALRTVFRRYLKNREGDTRDAIYLELHLKGLSSLGRRAVPIFPELDD
ncbi:MAG: LPS assembly protein LptD [Xanthomonadales bacterium]|nr:LPS assembly protein LptD [Xanthomonadales bacterium]